MSLLDALIWGSRPEGREGFSRAPSPSSPTSPPDPELARLVAAFRGQLEDWGRSGRPGVPILMLPEAPAPQGDQCVSCGKAIPDGRWRCSLCVQAVHLALGMESPEEPARRRAGEAA